MGILAVMFGRMREKRRRAAAVAEVTQLENEAVSLEQEASGLSSLIDALSRPELLWDEGGADCPIVTKRGEEVIGVFEGVSLVEMRSRKRTYKGTSHGLSIRVAKGVYYRPSKHSGAISETVDEWAVLDDDGALAISNQRVVYTGMRFSREFLFSKLISWGTELDRASFSQRVYLLSLPVSTRVRTSAIAFSAVGNDEFRDYLLSVLQCGISLFNDTHEDFIRRLRSDVDDLRSRSKALSQQAAERALIT